MADSTPPSSGSRPRFVSTLVSEGRFAPGTVLAGRYRIVALLGRGGMGEVYRADDMALGQTVALKFLPEALSRNESALARFYNEVRTARQVSHPNVCRVYDLGESEGLAYLSMEYVDGEDLAGLLRRIGRLPSDKGLEIARKLCAGLAAAHDKGVLHRDLKPANVMLDSRGQVLITDFGLAGVAEQMQGLEVRNGTPAYMAPEQLAGTAVTAASDIYTLGLVLYEIFTGKRAFEAANIAELVRLQTQTRPPSMTSLARDLDPAVERVVLRCLDPEPRNRPAGALAVAAALPGGDPLAAALAAGETPSPQMVAASGETAGMSKGTAIASLAGLVVGLVFTLALSPWTSLLNRIAPELTPDMLRAKATDLLKSAGYTQRPVDWAQGFDWDGEYLDYVKKDQPRPDWSAIAAGAPSPVQYWYRQAQVVLVASRPLNSAVAVSGVTPADPSTIKPGMIDVFLDARGRLLEFVAMPPQFEASPGQPAPVDWAVLIRAAGLDPAQLKSAEPQWTSLAASDTRVAWTGVFPGAAKRPLRIEAAAWRGRPVYFRVTGPWTKPPRESSVSLTTPQRVNVGIFLVLMTSIAVWGLFLTWRNYNRGSGDVRGAFRLAFLILLAMLGVWIFGGHHVFAFDLLLTFVLAVSHALFWAAAIWLMYMALEPVVRRRWPQALVSWSRILAGRIHDPLVGRDMLYGLVLAAVWYVLFGVRMWILLARGGAPDTTPLQSLAGAGVALAYSLRQIPGTVQSVLLFFFTMFGLRALLRKEWLAVVVFPAVFMTAGVLGSDYPVLDLAIFTLVYGILSIVVGRFGLVALATGVFTTNFVLGAPLTLDASSFYFDRTLATVAIVLAIAAFAFHAALAGRRLLKDEWFS